MSRPDTMLDAVDSQLGGWDATVDNNNDKLRDLLFNNPYPMPLVHIAIADSGSIDISTLAASDYKWCKVCVVDAATPATNGHEAISNGTDWKYVKTMTTV